MARGWLLLVPAVGSVLFVAHVVLRLNDQRVLEARALSLDSAASIREAVDDLRTEREALTGVVADLRAEVRSVRAEVELLRGTPAGLAVPPIPRQQDATYTEFAAAMLGLGAVLLLGYLVGLAVWACFCWKAAARLPTQLAERRMLQGRLQTYVPAIAIMLYVLFPMVVVTVAAAGREEVDCSAGYPVSIHLYFGVFLIVHWFAELALLAAFRLPVPLGTFTFRFLVKNLNMIDTYGDFAFTFIAKECGTTLYIPAIVIFAFGVLLTQYSLGACIAQCIHVKNFQYLFLRLCHLDVLCSAFDFTGLTEDVGKSGTRDSQWFIFMARLFGEDVPMGVLQAIFLAMYSASPFVVFQVVVATLITLVNVWPLSQPIIADRLRKMTHDDMSSSRDYHVASLSEGDAT